MKFSIKNILAALLLLFGLLFLAYGSVKQTRNAESKQQVTEIDGIPVVSETQHQEAASKGFRIGGVLAIVGILVFLAPSSKRSRKRNPIE